jgi:invasion protein IalB
MVRRVIGRFFAAAVAIGVVAFATATESDTSRLSARGTEAQIVKSYGPDAKASCKKKHGYWDYKCRVEKSSGTITVDVRVDDDKIIDRTRR